MDEVDQLGLAPEHGREGVVVVDEHSNLLHRQQISISPPYVAQMGLVRY